MATWTTVPDASLEPGKPIRSIDALALRDNPVAIAEGASGAPKIADAALGSTVTSAGTYWVLARNAAADVGAVGTYAFLRPATYADYSAGATLAGSNLRYSSAITDGDGTSIGSYATSDGGTPTGTWRCMGARSVRKRDANGNLTAASSLASTLWLRIS